MQKLARTVTSAQDTDANAQRARKSVVLARSSGVDRRKSSEETNLWKAERSKSASEDAGTAANALDRDKKKIADARLSTRSECHGRMCDVVQLVDFDSVLVGSGVAADEGLEV